MILYQPQYALTPLYKQLTTKTNAYYGAKLWIVGNAVYRQIDELNYSLEKCNDCKIHSMVTTYYY